MKKIFLPLVLILTAVPAAQANSIRDFTIPMAQPMSFIGVDKLESNAMLFQSSNLEYLPRDFATWVKTPEAHFMNLHEAYVEPERPLRHRSQNGKEEALVIFEARAKGIIDKPASEIKLKSVIELSFMEQMNKEIRHKQISSQETMPVVTERKANQGGEITNFKEVCGGLAKRPALELSLKHLSRPNEPWCRETDRSICVESCFALPYLHQQMLKLLNKKYANDYEKKDLVMASQSEVRYFVSEAEWGKKRPVSDLTGIKSPVRGIIEQNIFYFNQLFQAGKLVAIIQEHPTESSKSIVTVQIMFAIQKGTYTQPMAKDILLGNGGAGLNTESGVTAGLPKWTKESALNLMQHLAK